MHQPLHLVIDEAVEIKGRSSPCQRIVRVTERSSDRNGQILLMPQITLEGWWTNLEMASDEVIVCIGTTPLRSNSTANSRPILIWSACPVVNLPPMRWSWPWVA
jgi:hypothetical protein